MGMQAARKIETQQHTSPTAQVLDQIAHCVRMGCVIRIEHTPVVGPRFSPWEIWGTPACYNGDIEQVYNELEQCCEQHPNHFVRLNIEDYSCNSRFSFVVHEPHQTT